MKNIKVVYQGRTANQLFQTMFGMWLESLGFNVTYTYEIDKNIPTFYEKDLPGGMGYNKDYIETFILRRIPRTCKDIQFVGYWQDFSYVSNIESQAKDFIRSQMILEVEYNELPCVVHVRGTDYKGWGLFDICKRDYYLKCLSKLKPEYFIVVSDDINYAKLLLQDIPGAYFHLGTPREDFTIISKAKTGIIPNSSFSLLATWVGEGIFYAPLPWFNHKYAQGHEVKIYPYHDRLLKCVV